jgi:CHAD domain-containing protein
VILLDSVAVEWEFDAVDLRAVSRWLAESERWAETGATATAGGAVTRIDVYLETSDWRFRRAGYALRVRRVGRSRGCEAMLEALGSPSAGAGLRSNRALTEPVVEARAREVLRAPGPVGGRVRAVAGRKRVRPLFEVRSRRQVFSVVVDGLGAGELVLDETTIRPAGEPTGARLRRVEVRASKELRPTLAPFVERLRVDCSLQPAGLSQYEAGLLSAGHQLAAPVRFGATDVEAEMPIGAVALAVLRRHFTVMLSKEPGARLGDEVEELHDMRVATRRLRAALSLFAGVLPQEIEREREELRWVGQMLGVVRDLDVQIEQLHERLRTMPEADRAALERLGQLLDEQRRGARAEMLEALDSPRYEAFVARFGKALRARRAAGSGSATAPARAVAPDLIERRYRAVRKAASKIDRDSPAPQYHRLRIRCKRFRYALEFLADLYPTGPKPLIRRLVAVQDLLGSHQDAEVAIERLRKQAAERGSELGPETTFAMGEIAERHRSSATRLRQQFPAAYSRVARPWKQFRRHIEEQRPKAAPSSEPLNTGSEDRRPAETDPPVDNFRQAPTTPTVQPR